MTDVQETTPGYVILLQPAPTSTWWKAGEPVAGLATADPLAPSTVGHSQAPHSDSIGPE